MTSLRLLKGASRFRADDEAIQDSLAFRAS